MFEQRNTNLSFSFSNEVRTAMSRAQPAAAAPSVTTDEVLPAIPMSVTVGQRLLAQDAIVVRRREEYSTKGRKRKCPASKHKPKAKRRENAKRKQLGLDSSTIEPFWNQDITLPSGPKSRPRSLLIA